MGGGIFMLEGKERIRACIGGLADFKTVTSGCTGFFFYLLNTVDVGEVGVKWGNRLRVGG